MAICNLFKKLNKPTGEILMFSQWAEDLTQNHTKGYSYRATPSRFITANIDFSKFRYDMDNDLNISFPKYLQNYFENGCAVGKGWSDGDFNWDPNYSTNLFWNTLLNGGLIHVEQDGDDSYIPELNYIGDINIQSYDEMHGMGYSEIYCYIPNNAPEMRVGCNVTDITKYITNFNNVVEGYDVLDEFGVDGVGVKDIKYNYGAPFEIDYSDALPQDSNKFEINSIIILYNIYSIDESGNSVVLYENIPLGWYLPGCFENKNVTNTITKWYRNQTIYNSGTSYGIRICTRFSITPQSDSLATTEIELIDSESYNSLVKLMSGMADNLKAMKSITRESVFTSDNLKDTLNIFQNSKTNVPYILDINGVKYWFVNGKNTGVPVNGEDSKKHVCSNSELLNLIYEWIEEGIVVDMNIKPVWKNKNDYKKVYYNNPQPITDVVMNWNLINKYTSIDLVPDTLVLKYPDGTEEYLDTIKSEFIIPGVTEDNKYTLTATYKNKVYVHDVDFKFYMPSYFGFINEDMKNKLLSGDMSVIVDNESVTEYTLPTPYNRFKFLSNGDFIVYAYPKSYGKLDNIIYTNNYDSIYMDFMSAEIKLDYPKRDGSKEKVDYYVYCTTNYTGAGVQAVLDFTNINNAIDTCQVI